MAAVELRGLTKRYGNQAVVDDDVVAPEKMPDDRDIGRMAADQDDTVLATVYVGEGTLELAMDRALAGDRTTR